MKFIRNNMNDYKILEMWECDFDLLCKNDVELTRFLKDNPIYIPLNPRDALYGGRTNAFKLKYVCDDETKINYYDYTSLYPYVQKTGKYPVGHPEIITENFDQNQRYFGLIKCKILPPNNLYIPVLPTRINNKLIFALCNQCAYEQNKNKCLHNQNERALFGTWISEEVYKAIECGYKLIKLEEVWHWKKTEQYNGESGGIFTEYINRAIQEKQEASGYPCGVINEDQKDKYINDYFKKEGISLDKNRIMKNSGKRQVAKLKANSQWGFLAMKTNKVQHKIITEPYQWFQMIMNRQYVIHQATISEEDKFIHVRYTINDEMHTGGISTNVVVASFVTAYARLKLLSEMHKLDKRVLYCDTDSIFFTQKPGEYTPDLGDYLGEFTNELDPSEGNYISEFFSAGPKNYCYKTDKGMTHTTVKGFTLNFIGSETVNFDSIKQIVTEDKSRVLNVEQNLFIRDKNDWTIRTEKANKQYRFVYDKRVLKDDLTTLPYGHVNN
jgi:hypothetical protein